MTMYNIKKPAIAAGEFKARCLELISIVAERGEKYIVTKHGKPVAELHPIAPGEKKSRLLGSITYHGDITAPLEAYWDAEK